MEHAYITVCLIQRLHVVLGVLFRCWGYELYCGGFIKHPRGSAKLCFLRFPSRYTLAKVGYERESVCHLEGESEAAPMLLS